MIFIAEEIIKNHNIYRNLTKSRLLQGKYVVEKSAKIGKPIDFK